MWRCGDAGWPGGLGDAVTAWADRPDSYRIRSEDSGGNAGAGVGLSPAGEQYVDFAPVTTAGPYLSNGSVITRGQATVPVSLSRLLADADGALAQADTKKLEIIKRSYTSRVMRRAR